jgi:hypothetical protein
MDSLTMKINNDGTLKALNQHDLECLLSLNKKDRLDINRTGIYNIVIKYGRMWKTQGEYWLLMSACGYHLGFTPNYWHSFFKDLLLPKKSVHNKLLKKDVLISDSTAYDKMDQYEFENYADKIKGILLENGYPHKEMIKTFKEANI